MRYWLGIVRAPRAPPTESDILMSGNLLQADRLAELTTPLGKDVLVLTDFSGSEGLGELFEYHIEALSEQENIDFDQAIGTNPNNAFALFNRGMAKKALGDGAGGDADIAKARSIQPDIGR